MQLLGTLPHPPALRLHCGIIARNGKSPTLQWLLQHPPSEPVSAALRHLQLSPWVEMPAELVPSLLALTALTCLQLNIPKDVLSLPDGISHLRSVQGRHVGVACTHAHTHTHIPFYSHTNA